MRVEPTAYRNIFVSTWLLFCAFDFLVVGGLYSTGEIGEQSLEKFLACLTKILVPYIGAILSFYLAHPVVKKANIAPLKGGAVMSFVVAMFGTLLWNGSVATFIALLPVHRISVEAAIRNIDRYSAMLSWIAAPGVGFFLGTQNRR